ncbi:hypothetical protein PMI42_00193 [Bradyrhizobium sp. YR681]|uniref:DUF2235 domain-containing protein n=1 Tax=Bradyrhizobium sp. YR681 TaxID=1144344 RepID=UPI000270FCD8|nr:DUF2235 domain-containing protein [Bradyrhizobium sp. YR681]EJN16223.1 hypothetical protein PMI42_00193 [Bradyrhizobium sp. YR681]
MTHESTLPSREAAGESTAATDVSAITPSGRKIVVFADGTGNAFSTQESNVWRLYEALDRTKPDQIAYYIKGVGTAGWKPFAILDGITGIGVPSNVRTLYRFLCWTWKPGDEIYIFGFSRGAFTARTLAGLIASEGLVPAAIDGEGVSHADMERNAMAAWRAYRSKSVKSGQVWPTVLVGRWIRDAILLARQMTIGKLLKHLSYDEVQVKRKEADDCLEREMRASAGPDVSPEQIAESRRDNVHVEFLGVFDTVEAFGVPIEELRVAIDYVIWPISFRNGKPHAKIKRIRHALALDDERTTFHPIRFDQSDENEEQRKRGRIKEAWFAGVHSDVGGGYPDGNLSYVPLTWMAGQVENDLRFQPNRIDYFRAYQSVIGPVHDSRAGAAIMYRYSPRPIENDPAYGGPPVVHHSVVQRMLHGSDNYAPITLPAEARVWLPGTTGETADLTEPARARVRTSWQAPAASSQARQDNAAAGEAAVRQLPPPNSGIVQLTLDIVWWRRVSYFVLLALLAVVLAWPKLAAEIVAGLRYLAELVGLSRFYGGLEEGNDRVARVLAIPFDIVKTFVPAAAGVWLDTARTYPLLTIVLALLIYAALKWATSLRDRIHARARLAWIHPDRKIAGDERKAMMPQGQDGSRSFARKRRLGPVSNGLAKLFSTWIFPGTLLLGLFAVLVVASGRSAFNWYAGRNTPMCATAGETVVPEQLVKAEKLFETSSMCWGSGLFLEKGYKYRILIKVKEPWFDRTIMSGPNGFQRPLLSAHGIALPVRRWYGADWFQPIARIGKWGTDELALVAVNQMPADEAPRKIPPKLEKELPDHVEYSPTAEMTKKNRNAGCRLLAFDRIDPSALPAAQETWKQQGFAEQFVAEFIAPESGELFLYLNDAIQILPFLGPYDCYYGNNSGTAEVYLQRVPMPMPLTSN